MSCNPNGSFINDAKSLSASTSKKRRQGVPFYPVKAIPVDMFPHTNHTELITLFSRLPQSKEPTKEESNQEDSIKQESDKEKKIEKTEN